MTQRLQLIRTDLQSKEDKGLVAYKTIDVFYNLV